MGARSLEKGGGRTKTGASGSLTPKSHIWESNGAVAAMVVLRSQLQRPSLRDTPSDFGPVFVPIPLVVPQ